MGDTIYALATPPGKSGVAVIRVSGDQSFSVAYELSGVELTPRHAHFLALKSGGEIIDEAVVIGFKGPASFTGEDVVEFQIHGSRAGINALARELENNGIRLAEAGEFTRRALENGKLDLIQVEALADFIDSDTEIQRKQSVSGYLGRDSEWISSLRETLVQIMSLVTLSIDFSDEELPHDLVAQVESSLMSLKQNLEGELDRSRRSLSLRSGFRVAVLGKPNVGKSSLVNVIAGREVAIATEIPGTTRDVIEVFVDLNGLPIIFMDTAGLRETDDVVEGIGVNRAQAAAEDADLRIFLYERRSELEEFSSLLKAHDLLVQSKSDLLGESELSVSALSGEGVKSLLDNVATYFSEIAAEPGRFRHQRQIDRLSEALVALDQAYQISNAGEVEFDILAEYLRRAVFSLDHLVGRVDVEDMLDVIFSQFCIGK